MVEMTTAPPSEDVLLFNSPLETGLRTLVVLDALHPRTCSMSELTWFDHLVVHTADIEGPDSLHPDLPSRGGELLVRRHLVTVVDGNEGVRYAAGEESPSFVELLDAPYTRTLKLRAHWLAGRFKDLAEDAIRSIVHDRLGRWTLEFQGAETLHEPSA